MLLFKSVSTGVDGDPSVSTDNSSTLPESQNPLLYPIRRQNEEAQINEIRNKKLGQTNDLNRKTCYSPSLIEVPVISAFNDQAKKVASMAEVEVNGVKIRALIDSGATKSIAPIYLAQSLGITLNPTDNRRKWLMADNSSALSVLGTAKVRLTLGGSIIEQELVFTDKLAYDLIIGVDVLAELGCRIDYSRRTIETERAKISFDCSHETNSVVAALQDTITVEPRSVKVLWRKDRQNLLEIS